MNYKSIANLNLFTEHKIASIMKKFLLHILFVFEINIKKKNVFDFERFERRFF